MGANWSKILLRLTCGVAIFVNKTLLEFLPPSCSSMFPCNLACGIPPQPWHVDVVPDNQPGPRAWRVWVSPEPASVYGRHGRQQGLVIVLGLGVAECQGARRRIEAVVVVWRPSACRAHTSPCVRSTSKIDAGARISVEPVDRGGSRRDERGPGARQRSATPNDIPHGPALITAIFIWIC
jgi:hypothetical protein